MRKSFRLITAAALFTLASATVAAGEDVLATVDGEDITRSDLDAYADQRGVPAEQKAQMGDRLLNELIAQQVIFKDALRQELDKDPEVVQQLEQARMQVLINAAVRNAATQPPITDDELQAAYDKSYSEGGKEYNARHILVEEQDQAEKLIEELDGGADFAALAKEHSTGPSGKQGGKLGWFSPDQMVSPFSQAVAKLTKGSYTREPVKTQFGWHVIKLEDTRDKQPPAFKEVKEELRNNIRRERVQGYVQQLRSEADVQMQE